MSVATPAVRENGARSLRLGLVLFFTALSYAIFYWAASRFYYGNATGLLADLSGYIGNVAAALVDFRKGLLGWIGGILIALANFAPFFALVFIVGVGLRIINWLLLEHPRPASPNPITDRHFRNIFFELVMFTALAVFVWWIVGNTVTNLQERKIASGFDFLSATAGFGINQVLFIDYTESSSYGTAFLVGLINTLVLSFLGIVLATILGFIVGIMRLSKNWVIAKLAAGYVEIFRNIPLLLQIFAWYNVALKPLPQPRRSIVLFDSIYLNNRGIYSPKPIFEDGWGYVVAAFFIGIIASIAIARWAKKRQMETGQPFPVFLTSLGLIFGLPLIVFFLTGMPVHFDYPHLRGFNFQGGMRVIPEFTAMLMALTIYTATFIAEIVRAGILAVPHGQTEAALALGLTRGQMLRLVIIPQALRVIIPPLTSQYLNLTKNSSLAVAIAYPDLVAVGGIILNQSGQAVEIIALWMLVYLSISLATSAFMNWYNAKMKLVER